MSNSRQTKILFLDGTEINVLIQPSLSSRDLLDMVFSHLHIKTDKSYFGIFWKDSCNQKHWLDLERNVLDQELPPNKSLLLFFGVRFFCESFTCLSEDSSVLALFYQIVRNLHSKELCFAKGPLLYETYAHILQALHGDYKEGIEHEIPDDLVDVVIEQWRGLKDCSRGKAVVLTIQNAENSPSYGMHYFQVKDKQNNLHWLGVSHKGIGQFDYENRTIVTKMFTWKQLENLYYREKKFSIEVHDSKRLVQSKSTYNIYEETQVPERYHGHIHSSCDELSTAINEPTTQVSTSRRTFSSGSVYVHAWFTNSLSLTKNIWQTAIEQHKHYLRPENFQGFATRTNEEIVKSLDRAKFVAVGKYSKAVMNIETLTPEERKERKIELEKRKLMLEEKLKQRLEELKASCIEEYELTGHLPKEYPGDSEAILQKKVGTLFPFPPKLFSDHADIVVNELEKKVEIVKSVVAANKKVYKESKGTIRRKHKFTFKTSASELRKLEDRLNNLKIKKGQKAVHVSKSVEDFSDDDSLDDLVSPRDSPALGRENITRCSPRVSKTKMEKQMLI
ncbi:DgyrCDS11750 [Dimorphilus gyrociliatus]|uniref:DgyrCDS11750 n=1 Tax=Dimorphilus gyrociliatus TaxID=2664684 RepID=A0A7I8W5M6_9ANNE|nr:DgyrCDS11750 [Dimorphilus gyrociliatus]